MGRQVFKRSVQAPGFNLVKSFTSTAAVLANSVVKAGTAVGTVKPTTGTSGRLVVGVATNGATAAGRTVWVQLSGIATVSASSKAIARGTAVRATSGAAAATVGGTVKQATGTAQNLVGIALTSAAASTGARTITVLLAPTLNNPTLT